LADTNFPLEKNLEVENFQLLTMTFLENFLSVEIFLEWKWALTQQGRKKEFSSWEHNLETKISCRQKFPADQQRATVNLHVLCKNI
jgi:hypothetical protein